MHHNYSFNILLAFTFCLTVATAVGQTSSQPLGQDSAKVKVADKKWYESLALRGYTQIRYNRLMETNEELGCEQCDKSWGGDGGFFIRRMRVILYGQVHPRVYFYVQPDFANNAGGDRLNFVQLRDAYFDVGLTTDNTWRVRIGQSKVPFGFENLQSSQNRLPLDRNDALNSALANERDLGVFIYWAPKEKREMFSELVKSGLKGSGDYGVLAIGAYNGQTANKPELNDEPHVVTRVTWPFKLGTQIMEVGIQGYTGKYVIPETNLNDGVKVTEDRNYLDQRVAGTFVLYPQPFGIQAEYNIGNGPEYNKVTDSIETQKLFGGYAQIEYMFTPGKQFVIPFMRYQYYEGGKKHENDARSYFVRELEIGAEWQYNKNFEFVAMYTISSRRYEDYALQNNFQTGNLLRLQAQLNF